MRNSMLVIFLLAAFQVAFAQNSPAEKYVKAFSERKNKWLIEKNYDSLKAMIDSRCLYVHSNGWTQSADDIIKDLQSGKMVYAKVNITESQARQFESMVIVTGKGNFEGSVDQKPFSIRLAFTEVYVKRKDSWKMVSRQSAKLEQ